MGGRGQMPQDGSFGQAVRMRVLNSYFVDAGPTNAANAWEHVYRCLLWMNQAAGLAHIYDSNHMQRGGNFHERAALFTRLLCQHWQTDVAGLASRIDVLFRGCVADWRRRRRAVEPAGEEEAGLEVEIESDLLADLVALLRANGLDDASAMAAARQAESLSRDFFTIGNKRKNALGEGFEDLLFLLVQRVSAVASERVALRTAVTRLPGFRRPEPRRPGDPRARVPKPDLAFVDPVAGVTQHIVTAKWSLRQDRETQFQSEYNAYNMHRLQAAELRFALITNEFDIARLRNVLSAMPGGQGGYIFHNVYHVNLDLLEATHGARFADIRPFVATGKLRSLADFLEEMGSRYGPV